MARKQFQLEAVWRVRHLLEEKAKRELGIVQAEFNQAQMQQQQTIDLIHREHVQMDKDLQKGLSAREMQMCRLHIDALEEQSTFDRLAVIDIQNRLQDKRAEVIEATRKRKVIDRLREKFIAMRDYEERREEEKILGETALNQYLRQQDELK